MILLAIGATLSITVIVTAVTLLFKEKAVLGALIGIAVLLPFGWFFMFGFYFYPFYGVNSCSWMFSVFGALGVLIASCVLVIDTYLISSRVMVDEYIVASIIIYMDIIRIFVYIVMILGSKK